MLLKDEIEFARKLGARFSVKSPAIIDLAVSVLFNPVFQSRAARFGNEVVVSCLSSPVVVNSLVRHGLVPVFVDVCFSTYQVLLDEVEQAINPDLCRAIFLPHVWGNPFRLNSFRDLADEYGIWLLSEAVVGAKSDSLFVGSVEDISIFINDFALSCSSQMVYERIKSSHLYLYWKNISVCSSNGFVSDNVSVDKLHQYFLACGAFDTPSSFSNCTPSWTYYPITIKKASPFSRSKYLSRLQSDWFELPTTSWREFGNKKLQDKKMYGIDVIMDNTVLLKPQYAEEIISATKKFLETD